MSVAFNAALSGIASGLAGAVIAGMSPPGREFINHVMDRLKPEEYYGRHRIDMKRGRAEILNSRRKARLAGQAQKARQELRPSVQLLNEAVRVRQWN